MASEKIKVFGSAVQLLALLVDLQPKPAPPEKPNRGMPWLQDDYPGILEDSISMSPSAWDTVKAYFKEEVEFSPPLPRTDRAWRRARR